MSTLQTQPKVNPKDVSKLETAWIGWLNDESDKSGKVSKSGQDFETKKNLKLRDDIGTTRAEKFRKDIATEKSRVELIKGLLKPPFPDQIKSAIEAAENALASDLSIPKNNDLALQAMSELSRKVNEACKSVQPGIGPLLKEIVTLESSVEYRTAVQLTGSTVGTDMIELKRLVNTSGSKFADLSKKVHDIRESCQNLVHTQSATKTKIANAEQAQKQLADSLALESQELRDACQQHLSRSVELLRAARQLEVEAPTKVAIESYQTAVDQLLLDVEKERQAAEAFKVKYANADKAKKKDLATLTQIQNKIRALQEGATNAGFTRTPDAILKLDALATTFNPTNDLQSAQQFLADMETAIDLKRKEWETAKARVASLIRYMDKALASSSLNDDEYVMGTDSRSENAKKLQTAAQAATELYARAIDAAKQFKYVDAISILDQASTGTGALVELEKLQKTASQKLGSTSVKEDDLKARAKAFQTAFGEVTDKSRIRFDSDAMQIMMQMGTGLDSDGDLVYSEQFVLMKDQLEAGLKMWHELVDVGCDPFKAAERAFEGIPENFWPPQAVRVIAMFRKAEAEFAGEREAAEITAGLQASKVSEGIDVAKEVAVHAAERTADVFSGMMTWFKEKFKGDLEGLKDSEIEKKAAEFFKANNKIDFKAATEAVGGLAAGFGALNGAYNVGKDAKDIHEARQKIEAYDPETDSPVALKIAEFERNRAVWHLISDMADTVISALGPATSAVPALGVLGDAKGLVIAVGEAHVYFCRLREVKATEKQAKTDPESLAELALANEAHKLGLLGFQKAFDAAICILKIVGQGLDMGGVTAAAGFGVKAGATVLMYCGKALFKLINWRDRRNAVKALADARANPTDILVVEIVFERCTMYSRFLLADGALNGDAWCRQYVLSRGVTDGDLDNPNTSTAVIREYLNVTFQPLSGDAEEDDDLGTSKQEKKKKDALPSEEQDYNPWQPGSMDLTTAAFTTNHNQACETFGLKRDKQLAQAVIGLLTRYEKLSAQAEKDISAAKLAFTEFTKDTNNQTAIDTAESSLETAIDSAAALGNLVNHCVQEFSAGILPVSTTKDTKGKFKVHASFQNYLREMASAMEIAYAPVEEFRNQSSKQTMALKLKMDVGSPELAKKTRDEFERMSTDLKNLVQQRSTQVKQALELAWETLTLKTKCAGKGVKAKLIEKVVQSTGLEQTKVTEAAKNCFNKNKGMVLQSASGMCYKLVCDEEQLKEKAKKTLTGDKLTKELGKIKVTIDKRVEKEIIEYWKTSAAMLLSDDFDEAIGELFSTEAKAGDKFTAPTPIQLTRKYWQDCKVELEKVQWEFQKTGIGPQLAEYEKSYKNWLLLPKDDQLQAAYNGAFGKLLKYINTMPLARKDGIAVPGLKKFKAEFIAKLKEEKSKFDEKISDPEELDPKGTSGEGWVVPESKLDSWPITLAGWELMHKLATKHGWEGHNGLKSIGRYFRRLDSALGDFDNLDPNADQKEKTKVKTHAVECAQSLLEALSKWDPNVKMLRAKAKHPGIEAYQTKIVARISSELLNGKLK